MASNGLVELCSCHRYLYHVSRCRLMTVDKAGWKFVQTPLTDDDVFQWLASLGRRTRIQKKCDGPPVTFSAADPLANTKLYCLATKAVCEFLLPPHYCRLGAGSIPLNSHCEQKTMRDDWVIYPLLNRRCTKTPRAYPLPKWPILCRVGR